MQGITLIWKGGTRDGFTAFASDGRRVDASFNGNSEYSLFSGDGTMVAQRETLKGALMYAVLHLVPTNRVEFMV